MFFQGNNTVNLDAKGRLAVPVKHRERLAESSGSRVVVTINPRARCLWLFAENDWEGMALALGRMTSLDRTKRALQQLLLGHAADAELDAQGRILLPADLRAYAGLNKRVTLVGLGSKCELWDADAWTHNFDDLVDQANTTDSHLSVQLDEMDGMEDMPL
ncbi:MAG: division/cell wall cluster transcriptional repressor MraZ [Gammaproteobacteria bacterium]